jgi:hypothetical protein
MKGKNQDKAGDAIDCRGPMLEHTNAQVPKIEE